MVPDKDGNEQMSKKERLKVLKIEHNVHFYI